MISYNRHHIDDQDVEAVTKALKSSWLTQGPMVAEFEVELSKVCGSEVAAVGNATQALQLACIGLGIGLGDLVWTTPVSFVASANCARYLGADVGFVDVDPTLGTMSVTALEKALQKAKSDGAKMPKLVIFVHLGGRLIDLKPFWELSKKYGFKILEDSSHAFGASLGSNFAGAGTYSHASVFSFHAVKVIACAEGGAVASRDPSLIEKVKFLRSHGIVKDPKRPWRQEMRELGYNFRMTEMQAALGISQLKKLPVWQKRRAEIARRYQESLSGISGLRLPESDSNESQSAWHLYIVGWDPSAVKFTQDQAFSFMHEKKIGVQLHYPCIHLHPYYRAQGYTEGDFVQAEKFADSSMSLPLFVDLNENEQAQVIAALKELFR